VAALSFGGWENLPTAPSPGAKTDLIWNLMRLPMQTEFRAIVESEIRTSKQLVLSQVEIFWSEERNPK